MDGVSAIDSKRPTQLVVMVYLGLTFGVGIFLEHALGAIFNALRLNDAPIFGLADWTVSSALGYVVAIALGVGAWLHPRINQLSFEVAQELRKVTWPNREDTRTNTIAVVVFSFISAGVLGIFDVVSSKIMTQWIPGMLAWMTRHL